MNFKIKDLLYGFFSTSQRSKHFLILCNFFLIIFVYHILKDLKDSLVITSSDAGAQVIPFIKIWAMLPMAIVASYLLTVLYQRWGREKTLYIVVGWLLSWYCLFAFLLYPHRDSLHLHHLADALGSNLPKGSEGLVSMIRYWSYTLFYLSAELWSSMVLSVLFWGTVNDITSMGDAKKFYPMCVFTGNCAGILSGQASSYLSESFTTAYSWQSTLQFIILIVVVCGVLIMCLNRLLARVVPEDAGPSKNAKALKSKVYFMDSLRSIASSKTLLCIAALVVGFGMTNNLIEVIWKQKIKFAHSTPQAYNAYINQITSLIGMLSLISALCSRWLFKTFSFRAIAMLTPVILFITSVFFFGSHGVTPEFLEPISGFFGMTPLYFVMTLGSLHYIFAMTAKYSLFDMCKEMGFLSINADSRMRAKAVIDSVGSRLGKSGSSLIYQVLLIFFASESGHIAVISMAAVGMIAVSVYAANHLGDCVKESQQQPQADMEPATT